MTDDNDIQDGRRLRRADSRERLYDAAMALLETQDFDDLSVDEICRQAGAGRATFFRIYGGKTGLILEFNRRLAARAAARLDALGHASARESLFAIGDEIALAWQEVSPAATSLAVEFLRTLTLSDIHHGHPDLLKLITKVIKRGIEEGELKASFPPKFLGSIAVVQISSAVMLWFDHHEQNLPLLINEAIDQWLNGAAKAG